MTEQEMIADGWRKCAAGRGMTQHCGMVDEARAQERARIAAIIREQITYWQTGQWIGQPADPSADDMDEVVALLQVLAMVEAPPHE